MGQQWLLNSDSNVSRFNEYIASARLAGKPPRIEFINDKRSLPQNSLFYALYGQVATQKGDESSDEIKAYCKYHFGLPIVCGADPEYAALLKNAIRSDLDYETKMKIVDRLPVTSLMDTKQGSEYIDRIIRHYSQQGLCLMHPSEVW